MSETRTLFLQYDGLNWSNEQLDDIVQEVDDATDDDVKVIVVSDGIEFLDVEQATALAKKLIKALLG